MSLLLGQVARDVNIESNEDWRAEVSPELEERIYPGRSILETGQIANIKFSGPVLGASMQSHCLKHQERPAVSRCQSCSIPLCGDCTQSYAEGIFCSSQCHDNAEESKKRGAVLAKSEADLKEWQQRQWAIKTITCVVIGFALFFGWDHLPTVLTDNVEKLWHVTKAFVGKVFK